MAMTPQEWTVSALAVEFGLDRRTAAKRLAGVKPCQAGKRPRYRMVDAAPALLGITAEVFNLELERARLAHFQAEEKRRQVALMDGELIEAETAELEWGKRVTACRAKLLALPGRLADRACKLAPGGPRVMKAMLRDVVDEALSELARLANEGAKRSRKGRRKDDGAVGASAKAAGQPVGRPLPRARGHAG